MTPTTANTIRGTATCMVVGVSTSLMPASALPHKFGYYAAAAAFVLGLRYGSRAFGMLLACCVAIGIAEIAGQGVCTPNSSSYRCGVEAAAPLLIFGYFLIPTIAGAALGGIGRLSGTAVRSTRPSVLEASRERVTLRLGHTAAVALAAATTAFIAVALLPLSGEPLFLPSIAACVALGLTPTYCAQDAPLPAAPSGTLTW